MCANGEMQSPECNNQRAAGNRLLALHLPMLCFLAVAGPLRGQHGANPVETTTTAQAQPNSNDPIALHDPGIYYLKESATSHRMVSLEPASLGTHQSSSFFETMTSCRGKWKTSIRGSQAHLRITERRPTFYFYLPPNHLGFPGVPSGDLFAMSPREFVLAQLESKKKEREVPLDKASIGCGLDVEALAQRPSSVRSKDQVPLAYEKVGSGIYKIRPHAELKAGEYGFFYAGSLQMPEGRLFDFGIERAK